MFIWRRHVPSCPSQDKRDPRCGCPIYREWRTGQRRFRKTLKTTNWQKALADVRREEIEGIRRNPESATIEQAGESYIEDARARGLKPPTIYKFDLLFRQLRDFSREKGLVFISDFTVPDLRRFRATWVNTNFSAQKKLELLKAFFNFCQVSEWIKTNPAKSLKPAATRELEIHPITSDEFRRVVAALDNHPNRQNRIRLRAIVLLMRYTGLRIRDVVTLRREHIQDGKLFLRTTKTGSHVYCPLPPEVLAALGRVESQGDYYFWSGQSKPKSAVGDYQRALRRLFKAAETPRVHAHLFRHTFATEMLAAGSDAATVATILGNTEAIVLKHYSHWISARQARLEQAVKNSWAQLGTVEAVGPINMSVSAI